MYSREQEIYYDEKLTTKQLYKIRILILVKNMKATLKKFKI